MSNVKKTTEEIENIGDDLHKADVKSASEEKLEKKIDEIPEKEITKDENNFIKINNLQEIIVKVKQEIEDKKLNPSVVLEGEAGVNFIDGQPHLVIDDKYVPYEEARIILQTRKVVREWVRLENLKKGIKDE